MSNVTDKIKDRIRARRRGWVFTPKAFLDLGPRATVDQVLSRLCRQGFIRRLERGIYDYPKQHAMLGALTPTTDELAKLWAERSGDSLFPSGAMAANLLGLSTQVPAKPIYLTNGASRTRTIAGRTIHLKHARIPILKKLSFKANLVIQALVYLGKDAVDQATVVQCAQQLTHNDIRKLQGMAPQLPSWLCDLVLRIQKERFFPLETTTHEKSITLPQSSLVFGLNGLKQAFQPIAESITSFKETLQHGRPLTEAERRHKQRLEKEKLEKYELEEYGRILSPAERALIREQQALLAKKQHLNELEQRRLDTEIEKAKTALDQQETPALPPKDTFLDPAASERFELTFNEDSREIRLNGQKIAKPHYDSTNFRLMEILFSKPNQEHNLSDLCQLIPALRHKSLHRCLNEMKFKGNLRTAFFNVTKTKIIFHPVRTRAELEEMNLFPL